MDPHLPKSYVPRPCEACQGRGLDCTVCLGTGHHPTICLTTERVLCPKHCELFRYQWPKGFAVYAILVVQEALKQEEISKVCDRDIHKLMLLLDSKPLCEWFSPTKLMEILLEVQKRTHVWYSDLCVRCAERKIGTAYRTANHWGRVTSNSHVCLDCVLTTVQVRGGNKW